MGIYSTLNIGRDALVTHQKAIEVSGHNIANINTSGYTRQRLVLQPGDPITTYAGQLGTGVRGVEIQRIYDRYLPDQINNAAQDLGRWESQKAALERVEIVFDEGAEYGLNNAMSEFWNAWQDLSNNPGGHTERTLLLAKSENLVNTFKTIYSDLEEIRNDLDSSISAAVDEINLLASQISDLNDNIESIEAKGLNANDYRDKRDQLLKELSGLIDFTSSENSDGVVTVTVTDAAGTGTFDLVGNPASGTLRVADINGDGHYEVEWSNDPGSDILPQLTAGNLKGWYEVRDVKIPDYMARLENLAETIRTEVNTEHNAGRGLDGSQNPFFVPTAGSGILAAGTFAVNPNIVADVNLIAAGDTSAYGDNRTAIDIANLQTALTMSGGTATFDDFYSSLVGDVGIEAKEADLSYEHQFSLSEQLDNYRESISGVSLDEEMVNLIKFQHAYDAAAKLITTVDELLDTLIRSV